MTTAQWEQVKPAETTGNLRTLAGATTDGMSFSTDCQRLPGKYKLPNVDKTVLLDWRGRGIVGSEKTTEIYGVDAAVTTPEVLGLQAGKHGSWHMGDLN